jgi:uncharacterized protein (TIGR02466 family)
MEIKYNFYYWGPFLFKTKILKEEVKKILSFCKRDEKLDCRHTLAGHINEEYVVNNKDIFPILSPYTEVYLKTRNEQWNIPVESTIEIDETWVNYMKQGEFNPPHTHLSCDLSCVLYLQIPKDIIKNKENHVALSSVPGSISFMYGENLRNNIYSQNFFPEEGDFFIFPAWLQHCVFPFKSDEERISLSANFKEINANKN